MQIQITILPREGVRDPQGEAVLAKLRQFSGPANKASEVTVGKLILLTTEETDPEKALTWARGLCKVFLANEVVEDFEVKIFPEN